MTYRKTLYGAPRFDIHAVTPAEHLAAEHHWISYVQHVTHGGQYYPIRGRFQQSGVAVPSGGRPAPDAGSAA